MKQSEYIYKKTLRKIIQSFFQGLLLIAPISITIFVIFKLFEFIDGLIPVRIPGLGLLIILGSITIIGMLGSLIIRAPLTILFNRIMDQVPLIKMLYTAISDLLSAFVGQKKKFTEPVMVILSRDSNIRKLGFITERDMKNIGIGPEFVAVYLPHSYNFSGNMFVVPSENVIPVVANSADFMKFIVSGGVTRV
ncbi:MAG: DUF502 domain-containing protein [Bacteroidetes bacterium]|nr:MAG: DUF502 domain-containing protein [Bacteroidota bacterium]